MNESISSVVSPRGHMWPSSTVDIGWFEAFGEHKKFPCFKLIEIVILWVYYTMPFDFSLFYHFLIITFRFLYMFFPREDAGGLSLEYVLRIPSVS